MVKQHDAGKHLADADVRTFLRQLVDVVVHCTKHRDGSRTISEVYFDPAAKLAAAPSPALAAE
jgi:type IV secretion system protein VirB11